MYFLCFAGSEYHQFDFFVFPKVRKVEKHVLSRAWEGFVRNFISSKSNDTPEEGFTPPSTEKMVKQCLNFYLEPYQRVLLNKGCYLANFRLDEFVVQVTRIFQQHNKPVVQHQNKHCPTVSVDNIEDVRTCMYTQSTAFKLNFYPCRSLSDG